MSESSQVYVNDHTKSSTATHRLRTATNSAEYLLPYIQPGSRILDVGCGPGTISVDLAKLVPRGSVTAIDYTSDPVEQTKALAEEQDLSNVKCLVGDVHHLEFPDNTFDIVHVSQVLQHLADPILALREMRRVTKPGGIVAARESAYLSWYPELEGIKDYYDLQKKMATDNGGSPHPGARIHVWAHEAGFDRSAIKKSAGTWCYASSEERNAWGSANVSRCMGTRLAADAVQRGYCNDDDFKTMVKDWNTWIADEDGWFAILHGEILCWK